MESNDLEFLDWEKLNKTECQTLRDIIKPGFVVSGVELPWSLSTSKRVFTDFSENAEIAKVSTSNALTVKENEEKTFSTFLPSNVDPAPPPTPLVRQIEEQPRIPEPIQISANAPAFVPAAATMASVVSIPPFSNMHQNVQQFPPPFYNRHPFPTIPSNYPVTVGPPPGTPNLANLDVTSSSGGSHYHQDPSSYSPRGGIKTNEDRHKPKSYGHDRADRVSSRRKPSNSIKKSYLDNSSMDVPNMVPGMEMYAMNTDENVCLTMPGQVVDPAEQLHHPSMLPMAHHTPPFHMSTNPLHVPPGASSYTFSPNHPQQTMFFPMPFLQYPPGFIHQGGGGGVASVSPMMDNEMGAGHGNTPSHVIAGHYEGQPLTMSHSYPGQHHLQHSENLVGNAAGLIEEHYQSGQEMCVPRTMAHAIYEPPLVVGETHKDMMPEMMVSENRLVELPIVVEERHFSSASEPLTTQQAVVDECVDSSEAAATPQQEEEEISVPPGFGSVVVLEGPKEVDRLSEKAAEIRTKTPDPIMTSSLEDSGVDVGGESPTAVAPIATQAQQPPPAPPPPSVMGVDKAPAAPPGWGGTKSWADLFKRESNGHPSDLNSKQAIDDSKNLAQNGHDSASEETTDSDFLSLKIGRFLQTYKLDFNPKSVQPRGLINRSNWCYINATLQALLVCPPFYNLIKDLPVKSTQKGKATAPIMNSLIHLIHEFVPLPAAVKGAKKEELTIGSAFEPLCMHQMLVLIKSECVKGRQEDAEEFLSCILNGLHEELLAMNKAVTATANENGECNGVEANGHLEGSEDDSEGPDWRLMGPKGKGTVTHCPAQHSRSPVTSIFGGQLRSLLNAGSETSATLQPFFTLQLDIQTEGVDSVLDALSHFTVKETIQGYTCPKLKKEVEAFRRFTLEELPSVLILHFKRFVYDDQEGGSKKVLKKTVYPLELEITKEFLSPEVRSKYSAKSLRNYRLFAVVYHDGKEAVKGHYIADVYHAATGGWLRCDDRKIVPTTETQVLSYNSPCVPYLLFYGRNDEQNHH